MQKNIFIEDSFDKNRTHEYSLSIRISADGFSFCVYDSASRTYLVWKNVPFANPDKKWNKCMSFLLCEPFFTYPYKEVSIVLVNDINTLAPINVFEQKDYTAILKFNFPFVQIDDYCILSNEIGIYGITNIFAVPKHAKDFFEEQFPHVKYYNYNSTILSRLIRDTKKAQNGQVALSVHGKLISIAYADKGKLQFSNNFTVETASDIAYLCANVYEQFNLNQHQTKIVISGNVTKKDDIISLLRKHINNCELENLSEDFNYQTSFNTEDIYQISDLLNTPLCVL